MSEGLVSRAFRGRRPQPGVAGRLPPGQYLEHGFPVLSAVPTPHTPLEQWDFSIVGNVQAPKRWTWQELLALPHETPMVDIHCATKWSKFDTHWEGISVETLLQDAYLDACATTRLEGISPPCRYRHAARCSLASGATPAGVRMRSQPICGNGRDRSRHLGT
jgi:hypothetical protein